MYIIQIIQHKNTFNTKYNYNRIDINLTQIMCTYYAENVTLTLSQNFDYLSYNVQS